MKSDTVLKQALDEISRLRSEKAALVDVIRECLSLNEYPERWIYINHPKLEAALRSATETHGWGSDDSPVSDGSNRDNTPSDATEKGEPT